MANLTADTRLRRLFATAVLLALVSGVLVAVVRADGYHAPDFDLHDAGIWVTQRSSASVGRLNTELEVVDTRTGAGGANQDVLQSKSIVLVLEQQPDKLRALDVRTGQYDEGAELPAAAQVRLGGRTGAVLSPTTGGLWIAPGETLSGQAFTQGPTAELPGASAVAVGLDGIVHALVSTPARSEVVRFRPDGRQLDRKDVDSSLKPSQITAVGSTSVVLDRASATLAVPGGAVLPAASLGDDLMLQEPGPDDAGVLVAGDRQFGVVPLNGAAPVTYWDEGGGRPIAPVRLGACAWAAWQERPAKARMCREKIDDAGAINDPQIPPNSPLQFRVNRNRIVLNQLVTGTILVVDDGDTRRVDDWSQALAVTQEDDGSRDPNARQAVVSAQQGRQGSADPDVASRLPENVPPKAFDDTATTRERRPVIIRVLDNDVDPGDVLVVDSVEPVGQEVGTTDIAVNGTAVQFTPATGRSQPAVFHYTVGDGRGGTATAQVTVTIRPRSSNAPPEPARDDAGVDAGRSVTVNVLGNDRDPDGDALALTKAAAPHGSVQFRPDGTVVFTAPGTPGPVVVTYEVVDELNAVATGELHIEVRAPVNLPPVAVNDYVVAFVDREAVVNVLANDTDPNGDALTLFRVDNQSSVSAQWIPNGELRLRGEKPGSYLLSYDVTDGPTVASGVVRVDIQERDAQRPPVAVRDDVVLRAGVDTVAMVLANDYDPDGDVLVIERVESDLAARGLVVETIEHRALRIIAAAPLTESVSFTYTVSDGTAQAVGTVVVRSLPAGVNQAPIANRDEVTLRAGNVTAIRVLANDVDPDGDELTLTDVTDVPATDGVLFRQGNQLRYQAPEAERGAVQARYTVADSAGNKADGELVIHVTPMDASRNSPPAAVTLEARVVAGTEVTIRVPLVGVDPEGDAVTFLGFGEPPTLGTILDTGPSSMLYAAARESAGTDRFTYRLRDSLGAEATGTVLVGVIAPPSANSPPVAVPDRAQVRPGESVRVDVLANDSDPDSDPIELVPAELGKPARGSVKIEDIAVVYDAPPGTATGEVSFDYTIVDSRGASARAVVTVTITADPLPLPPIARDDTVSPQVAGATVTVDVLENDEDPDGDVRRLEVRADGQAGVDVIDGRLRFTMADRAMNFAYEITDAQKLSARAFVQVPLAAEADLPPVAAVDRAETEFNQAVKVSVLDNDRDPEGKPLSLVKVVGTPRNGTAEVQGNQVLFSPQKDFAGEGGFSYEVSDGKNVAQGSAVVVVKAQANRPPKFTALVVEIPAGGKREVNLTNAVTDPDAGDKHTFANARSERDSVSVSLGGTTLSISASAQAKGVEARVTVDVSDGKPDGTAQGVVTVKVLASDKPLPSAVRDTATTKEDAPVTIPVLANDVDPQGLGLRLDAVAPGTGGTPVVQGDQVVFTPAKGFFGQASFTYTLFDKTGDSERTARGTVDVTVLGRPSAPPAPTGTVRSRGVTLQWAVPSANGAPIKSYRVQNDAGAVQKCDAISETSCSIDGLTNGTTYRFQVQAVNEAGDSPWSPPSADLTPDVLPGTPAAPTGRFGDKAVTLSWVPPANDGTAISEYTLEISPPPPSGAGSQTLGGGTTTYVWQGLANGTGYRFRVKAKNGAGATEFSAYSNVEIPAGAPLAPAAPSATKGDKQATVSWSEPETNGDAIQRYELQVKRGGAVDRVEPIADPTLRSKVVTAQNGTSYSFAIRAENKAGWSAWSPDSAALVPCGLAAAVTGVSATEGDRESTLSFGAPVDNGCAITSYRYRTSGGSAQDLAGSRVVTGLTNGISYSFEVQACNSEGCGGFGPASNTVVPYGVPGQPSVSGSVNGQTLNWSWTTPSDNGRSISEFRVYLGGGLVQQGMATSFSRTFGYSETQTLAVEAVNARGAGARGSSQLRTVDPPGRVVTVDNRVTNGATQMREDDQPAYLSTVPENYCRANGCMLSGTDMWSGHQITAVCHQSGGRVTNGEDGRSIDDNNPGIYTSTLWYKIRWSDGRLGLISEVWIRSSDRGGAGLPGC